MNNFNEALAENRTRYQENLRKEILRAKREQKKETVITVLVGAFIVIATIMLLGNMSKGNEQAMTQCINEGHSTNYCARTV